MRASAGLVPALLLVFCFLSARVATADEGPVTLRSTGEASVRALEAALILSGQEGGDIRTAVLVFLDESGDHSPLLHLLIEIDGPALLNDLDAGSSTVDLYLYFVGQERAVKDSWSHRFELDLDLHRPLLERTGLKVPLTLELPPGEALLRVLVRTGAGDFGLRTVLVEPADAPARASGLLAPWFPETGESWVLGLPADGSGAEAWPVEVGVPPALPSCLPVLREGEKRTFFIPASENSFKGGVVDLEMIHMGHGTAARLSLPVRKESELDGVGMVLLEVELDTAELASAASARGLGVLGTWAIEPGSELGEQVGDLPPAGYLIVAPHGAAGSWPGLDLERLQETPTTDVAGAPERPMAPRLDRRAVQHEYRRALTALAKGNHTLARQVVGDLDERFEAWGRGDGSARLAELEEEVHDELRRSDPEALLPVLWLHAQLAEAYVGGPSPGLRDLGVDRVRRLVELYTDSSSSPEAGTDAASALDLVAGALQTVESLAAAVELFEAALELDDRDTTALLQLAATLEKQGRYADAVSALLRMIELDSRHLEARLRLGVNLRRTSEPGPARRVLGQLADLAEPRWIADLAYQELARLALAAGDTDLAGGLLNRALEKWPRHDALRIQLALVHDLEGRPAEAWRLLQERAGEGAVPMESARLRYNHWPRADLATTRARLESRSQSLRDRLDRALNGTVPKAGS